MCSLALHTAEGWSTTFVGAQIGSDAMETWSRGLERFNTARAKYDSAQFYDVDYRDLIADPMGTVADIYKHFGLTLTDEARDAMEKSHAESQSGERAPKHTYSLADYGLTVEAVKERFAGL
jgi:LPS sulfotransferase NodH